MKQNPILRALEKKGADKKALAKELVRNPAGLAEVVEGLRSDRAAIRYGCGTLLALASELDSSLLVPYKDVFVKLLSSDYRILRWNGTRIVGNLAAAAPAGWFEGFFDLFFSPITGHELIAAANVIGSAPAVAGARPGLSDRVAAELLKVERARYRTPECRNVALGAVIDAFDQFYEHLANQEPVLALVRRQLKNTRAGTAGKAEAFLAGRGLLPAGGRTGKPRRAAKTGTAVCVPF